MIVRLESIMLELGCRWISWSLEPFRFSVAGLGFGDAIIQLAVLAVAERAVDGGVLGLAPMSERNPMGLRRFQAPSVFCRVHGLRLARVEHALGRDRALADGCGLAWLGGQLAIVQIAVFSVAVRTAVRLAFGLADMGPAHAVDA